MNITKIAHKISLLHSTNVETPTEFILAKEIVDKISIDWTNPNLKILDAACGRGTFLLAVIEKLEEYGHARKHIITNMIHGVDRSHIQSMITTKALRLVADVDSNIVCDDSLTRKFNMKFDVVIGNPPYNWSDGTKQRKNNRENLWTRFVSKSFEEWVDKDGYVAMVVPKTWMSPSRDYGKTIIVQDYFKPNQVEALNIDECAKHFNVGSSFSYFVVKADESKSNKLTKVVSNSGTFDMDLSSSTWDMGIPTILDKDIISMLSKFYSNTKTFDWLRQYEGQINDLVEEGPYAVFHTPASKGKTFCNTPSYLHTTKKVMVSLSGRYEPFYDEGNTSPSGFIVCLKIKENETLENAKSVLDSKLYKLIVDKLFRYNGFINGNVLKKLPALDLERTWSDTDIYKHFNLTQEEIDAVERYN